MLKYSTSCVEYNHKMFCIYCGSEVKEVEESYGNHGRDTISHYPCDCKGAVDEQDLLTKLKQAKSQFYQHIERAKATNKVLMAKKEQEEEVKRLANNDISRAQLLILDPEKA